MLVQAFGIGTPGREAYSAAQQLGLDGKREIVFNNLIAAKKTVG